MIPITLKQISIITKGYLYKINDEKASNLWINTIITNSNEKSINSLFIALKGKNFDGHYFVKNAILLGATSLLIEQPLIINCPQIIVNNTRLAMGKIAAWVRLQSKAKVIGITGSSGKTSVKEMVSAILSKSGITLYTLNNFNNDIGVPLTLFRLNMKHKYIVIEMGANHIGEIAYSTHIVKPNSILINNLFAAHLEGFHSLNGVANAKGEIFQGLTESGTAIINLDSNDFKKWKYYLNKQQNIWFFSLIEHKQSNFYAKNINMKLIGSEFELHSPIGVTLITLSLLGKHNITNALAASALAISVGATLKHVKLGLKNIKPLLGRLYPIYLSPSKIILDDTYNANVNSMIAAINILSKMPGYRILVIGDMSELGNQSKKYHQEVSIAIKKTNLNKILSIGQYSIIISKQNIFSEHFYSKKKLILRLINLIKKYETISVLVKGSFSSSMKEVIIALQEYFLC